MVVITITNDYFSYANQYRYSLQFLYVNSKDEVGDDDVVIATTCHCYYVCIASNKTNENVLHNVENCAGLRTVSVVLRLIPPAK